MYSFHNIFWQWGEPYDPDNRGGQYLTLLITINIEWPLHWQKNPVKILIYLFVTMGPKITTTYIMLIIHWLLLHCVNRHSHINMISPKIILLQFRMGPYSVKNIWSRYLYILLSPWDPKSLLLIILLVIGLHYSFIHSMNHNSQIKYDFTKNN